MFCPKCGQQQIADNTRFCSRCGLPIDGLAQWLAGDAPPVTRDQGLAVAISPRRKGVRRGAKIMFLSAVLTPLFIVLSVIADAGEPLIIPFLLFLAGLSVILYSSIFKEKAPTKTTPARPAPLGSAFGSNALPPASNTWANSRRDQAVRTAELAQPPSVTENTTKLLRDDWE
jgi:hypothetical protein